MNSIQKKKYNAVKKSDKDVIRVTYNVIIGFPLSAGESWTKAPQ